MASRRYKTRYRTRYVTRNVYVPTTRNVYIPGQTVYRDRLQAGSTRRARVPAQKKTSPSRGRFRGSRANLMYKPRRSSKMRYASFLFNKAAGGQGGRGRMRKYLCGR